MMQYFFLNLERFFGYTAYGINWVIYRTPSSIKWILIVQLPIHFFLHISLHFCFNFCLSLPAQYLVHPGSTRMGLLWFFLVYSYFLILFWFSNIWVLPSCKELICRAFSLFLKTSQRKSPDVGNATNRCWKRLQETITGR